MPVSSPEGQGKEKIGSDSKEGAYRPWAVPTTSACQTLST